MTASKLGCILLSLVFLCAFGLWTVRVSAKLGLQRWWLLWTLLLIILYVSYAARFEQALWYPYDIPHLVLFGAATLYLLLDRPIPFAACLSVDIVFRETSVFLIVVALLLRLRVATWRYTLGALSVLWLFSHWLRQHLYPLNAFEANGVPRYRMAAPWHWPQLFSIVGFLWIPVCLGRRFLSSTQRLALYGASALMLLTFFFATWNETRVWSEWSVLFALRAATELEASFVNSGPPSHRRTDRA